MDATLSSAHQWLNQLVGEWTFDSSASMGPGQPPLTSRGREVVRSLGGLWIVCEGTAPIPAMQGQPAQDMTFIMALGHDPARSAFIGTWFASVMPGMFVYEGQLAGDTLTLNTSGPSCLDQTKTARYQDIIERLGPNQRVLRSQMQKDDGSWEPIMRAEYTRVR